MKKQKTISLSQKREIASKVIDVLKGEAFSTSMDILNMASNILKRRSIVT